MGAANRTPQRLGPQGRLLPQVVTKLFHITEPDKAFFGKKDYQQWRVIQVRLRLRLRLRGGTQ